MSNSSLLSIREHQNVREVQMARAPVNALDPGLIGALDAALDAAFTEGAPAVVLSGSPGMFSAGLDVPALLALDRAALTETWHVFFGLLQRIARAPVPVVSAITGHSPAGGAVLSIYTDYRIMARGEFRIGLNESQVGLPLPPCIYRALRYVVGARQAERLGVGGLLLTPEQALTAGLIDEIVEPAQTVQRAIAYAQQLLALPARAVSETRALARRDLIDAFDGLQQDIPRWVDVWYHDDTQRALQAMVARIKKPR